MKGFNESIEAANAYNISLGMASELKKTGLCPYPVVDVCFGVNMPFGTLEAYARNAILVIAYDPGIAKWPDGLIGHSIRTDLSLFYSGLGCRVVISDPDNGVLNGFAGIDAGLGHYYWNFIAEETYKEDGACMYRIRKEWLTAIPSACVEGGVSWKISGNMSLVLNGGYRFSAGNVAVRVINIQGWSGPTQEEDYVDYSGFFCNAGIKFLLGQDNDRKNKNAAIKGAHFPGIAGWLYSEAIDLNAEGLSRQAYKKILEAYDAAPDSAEIAELKKSIEAALKGDKDRQYLDGLFEEAERFKAKGEHKKAIMRYAEIFSADSQNRAARMRLDEYAALAEQELKKAIEERKKRNLKKALKAAENALDYGAGSEAWKLKSELEAELESNARKDSLYNEAVEEYRKGSFEKAVKLWTKVLEIDPLDRDAQAGIEKAGLMIREESMKKEKEKKAALEEARAFFNEGRLDEAERKCRVVLGLDPDCAECVEMVEKAGRARNPVDADVPLKR